ncbi:TolC family protein [Emticicia sp. SJ17W-69]|uniref:TolC family protein n=1 Tax=Emticicia sp. SJ17W-69 TaxID=3421657 RepID=UPI003EBEF535
MKVKLIGLGVLLFFSYITFAQKKLDLSNCEEQFLKNNLLLLAKHYNIDASKALTMQAKIWDLPYLSGEFNAINPPNGRVLDVGGRGQKALAIQQLIYLGGKRKNEVALAKVNEQIAELDFQDLLRNLKFQLRKSFFTLYFNNKKIETTDLQINHINDLVNAYTEQVQKANVSLKELIRLQSLLITFRNERTEIVNSNFEEQNNLKLLLNEVENIIPVYDETSFNRYIRETVGDIKTLEGIAVENRPDYSLMKKNIEANEWNVKWQQSLAKPDINLGLSYDQRGGAFNNQVNITFGIPLAFWNRNQGNIKFSQIILQQAKADKETFSQKLQTEIATNLNKWNEAKINYRQLSPSIISGFEEVYNGVLQNFQKRNISILEFTDFMESYNVMSLQVNESKKRVALTAEELNSVLNYNVF